MFVLIVCFAQKYHTLSHTHKNNPDLLVDNRFPGAREIFVERTGIKINVFFKATLKFETHQLQEFVTLPPVLTGWHTNVKFVVQEVQKVKFILWFLQGCSKTRSMSPTTGPSVCAIAVQQLPWVTCCCRSMI